MNKKTTYFFDSIISLFTVFSLSYLFFLKFNDDKTVIFLASVSLAFAASALWLKLIYRKKPQKNYNRFLTEFTHRSNNDNAEIVYNALKTRHNCSLDGNRIETDTVTIIVYIRHSPLTEQEAIDFALDAKRKTLLMVSSTEKNAEREANRTNKNIRIATFDKIAEYLVLSGAIIEPKPIPAKEKLHTLFVSALDEKNAGRYLSGAGIMLILSAINAFSPYYLCFSVILIILSLTAFIKGKISGRT